MSSENYLILADETGYLTIWSMKSTVTKSKLIQKQSFVDSDDPAGKISKKS